MRDLRILLAAGVALGVFAASAAAQDYPAKPVRIVVSSSAGGSPDIQIRLVTHKMTEANGYVWVIENLPGGGGNIAPERVAKSPPDGYTLLMASAGPLYINPSLYPGLPYDIVRDFEPITQISHTPNILVVHPSVPVKSTKELIAYAKANPGKLRFGSAGSGSSQHLSAELFKRMAGVDLQHIPYKSSSQMTTELVAGQIELAFQNAPLVLPYVTAGKLVALAVTTKTRLATAPEVPTLDGVRPEGLRLRRRQRAARAERHAARDRGKARGRRARRARVGLGPRAVRAQRLDPGRQHLRRVRRQPESRDRAHRPDRAGERREGGLRR